jgi:hypothetical protein
MHQNSHFAIWSCITYLINLGAAYVRNILGLVTFVPNLVTSFYSPFLVFPAKTFSNFHHFTTLFIIGCNSFSQSGKQWNPQNWHLPYTHSSLKNKTFESFGHKYNSHRLELLLYTWWWTWQVKLPIATPLRGLEHTSSQPHIQGSLVESKHAWATLILLKSDLISTISWW